MSWQLLFLLLMGVKWKYVNGSCVFQSDFGFNFTCAFKKSSIFRVRNLGGVKGYFGLGFSVGDDLGFAQSYSNTETGSKRRSVETGRSAPGYFQQLVTPSSHTERAKTQRRSAGSRSSNTINIRAPGSKQHMVQFATVPPFRPIHPGEKSLSRPTRLSIGEKADTETVTVVAVPAFASLPQSIAQVPTFPNRKAAQSALQNILQMANRRYELSLNGNVDADVTNSITTSKVVQTQTQDPLLPEAIGHALRSVSQATNISADTLLASIQLRQQQLLLQQQKQLSSLAAVATTTLKSTTVTLPVSTTPSTTTLRITPKPINQKYTMSGAHKVMNAPKEYYPVNYDKNFDDNFTSRVELPDTTFSCGDQKHFPGLYADEDLNCMVFHVCALTDDGLVMKSFLCPESTLFDQTILKCNWWFYVDCKASKKLYDSNIPISKSYQLMKALAFFSSYSKKNESIT